jgi:prepilin-type N-terminal cleavage/methylation domain-containing protein
MKGFSLIEFTISLFIVAVAVVLTTAMLRATTLTRHVRYEDLATKIASNEMEGLRAAGYSSLPTSGSFSDPLLTLLPAQATGTIAVSAYDAKTKQVLVTVAWKEEGQTATSSVALATLITQLGGLP